MPAVRLGKRINESQAGRVQHFAEVGDVRYGGIGQPRNKGNFLQGPHGLVLGGERYRAGGGGQDEEGNFLDQQGVRFSEARPLTPAPLSQGERGA